MRLVASSVVLFLAVSSVGFIACGGSDSPSSEPPASHAEAGADTASETSVEGGTDGSSETSADGGTDVDAGPPPDASADTSPEAAVESGADVQPESGCPATQVFCGPICVDTKQDPNNCGECGTVCGAGELCSSGTCAVSCQLGLKECSGLCINTKTDNANCGDCAKACAMGEVCSNGNCELSCQQGLSECDGMCINLLSDTGNCGGCGVMCASGKVCSNGTCEVSCLQGTTDCSGVCTQLASDNQNCGGCGFACEAGELCSNSACALSCQTGLIECNGTCANLQTDNANCGACQHLCPAGTACSGGACTATCGAGLTACGAFCRDTNNDPANCGACGQACGAGQHSTAVCSGSTCTILCHAGFVNCNGFVSDGCESNPLTDAKNCGGCGNACASGQCLSGLCSKLVFVSSQTYTGNLGGLAGADAKCQSLAQTAGLSGSFKAWLSDNTSSAASRLTHAAVRYVLRGGTLVAHDWNDLTDGTLAHAIDRTELGGAPPATNVYCGMAAFPAVWTGTGSSGAANPGMNCTGWTGGSGVLFGASNKADSGWTVFCPTGSCSSSAPVYCLEQ